MRNKNQSNLDPQNGKGEKRRFLYRHEGTSLVLDPRRRRQGKLPKTLVMWLGVYVWRASPLKLLYNLFMTKSAIFPTLYMT